MVKGDEYHMIKYKCATMFKIDDFIVSDDKGNKVSFISASDLKVAF